MSSSYCEHPVIEGDALMPRRLKFDRSRDCIKCKVNQGNIVIRHAVYCKKILEPAINAKASSPRRPKLKASGHLLISHSGGLGSSVLLDLLYCSYFSNQPPLDQDGKPRGGKDHPRNSSVWDSAMVCYVETCSLFPGMRDRTEEVRSAVDKYAAFQFIALRIEDAFDKSWWERVGGHPGEALLVDLTHEDLALSCMEETGQTSSPIDAMHSYFSSLPTQTAVASSIRTLIRMITLYTARSTGSSHLLLGTSLTSLSISLIASISQGAGYVIREEAQEEWISTSADKQRTRANAEETLLSVSIVRPLRDIGMKECAAYTWWRRVRVIGKERLPADGQSISGLTKEFIVGLEKDYPSTVSTIARSCAKLVPRDSTSVRCILCQRVARRGIQQWKSRISIRSLDKTGPTPVFVDPPGHDDDSVGYHVRTEVLAPLLCYACHTTLTSRNNRKTFFSPGADRISSSPPTLPLPVWVTPSALAQTGGADNFGVYIPDESVGAGDVWQTKHKDESEMRDTISGFLLDE